MYWYILVCTGLYRFVQFFNLIFQHRVVWFAPRHCHWHAATCCCDSAVHASSEEGDPHPCTEDEEFFETRPDAADVEEAISKFMEGMEKKQHTGYNSLHKPLQGLPVPEQKNASSMMQAEAFGRLLA